MIESPCISVCALDEDELCQGCYRTLDEIVKWASGDDEYKQRVLEKALERKAEDS